MTSRIGSGVTPLHRSNKDKNRKTNHDSKDRTMKSITRYDATATEHLKNIPPNVAGVHSDLLMVVTKIDTPKFANFLKIVS